MTDPTPNEGKPEVTCDMIHPQLTRFLEEIGVPEETLIWRELISPLEDQLRSCLTEELMARYVPEPDENDEIVLNATMMHTLLFISVSNAFLALRDQIANNLNVPEESMYPAFTDNPSDS